VRVGITGSPGTGKKTIGRILSKISHLEFLSINEFARRNHFATRVGSEYVIDTRRLYGKIETESRIVSGHLLPYVVPDRDLDLVIVLRSSPATLQRRYKSRKYSKEKTEENVEAEIIGVTSAECARRYSHGKLAEFDTTKANPGATARRVLEIIKGKASPSFGSIDWLSASTKLAFEDARKGKYNRFNLPKKITRFANRKARKSSY
jgi:adenylate kinase